MLQETGFKKLCCLFLTSDKCFHKFDTCNFKAGRISPHFTNMNLCKHTAKYKII